MKEYIVCCHSMEDLESLYEDMETPGGNLYIPDREVPVYRRRSLSRNTHYLLTTDEVKQLKNDPRVKAVDSAELIKKTTKLYSLNPKLYNYQSGDFCKSDNYDDINSSDLNWGLYRCTNLGSHVRYWGGPTSSRNAIPRISREIQFGLTGKNVDFVCIDGQGGPEMISHPEFKALDVSQVVNFSGSQSTATRFVSYNWAQHTDMVNGMITGASQAEIDSGKLFEATTYWNFGEFLGTGIDPAGTYNNVPQYATSGSGSGIKLLIRKSKGTSYADTIHEITIIDGGIGYHIGDTIVIAGRNLGGKTPENNLTIEVGSILLQGTYQYTRAADLGNAAHGTHTSGTVAGNTQGWARDANVYQIDLSLSSIAWDYVRAFHKTKPINPVTGRKNPTIVNASFGNSITLPEYETDDWGDTVIGEILGPIIGVKKRGVVTGFDKQLPLERDLNKRSERVLSGSQLDEAGIYASNALLNFDTAVPQCTIPINFLTQDADITDALAEGIIIVAAAGNESQYIDVPTGPDYNNKMYFEYYGELQEYSYHQGTAPGSVPGVICVGAIDADFVEWKAWYSNTGPRIDIYAPGSQVTSSFLNNGYSWSDIIKDRRSDQHFITRDSGTSMASPQVCGVIACLLEKYPNMTPADALNYIITTSGKNEFRDGLTDYPNWVPGKIPLKSSPYYWLPYPFQIVIHHAQGGPNRYLHFNTDETTYDGLVWPRKNHWLRPASGRTYPRSRIRSRG